MILLHQGTLLRHIVARQLRGFPSSMSVTMVSQEIVGNHKTPVEIVMESDTERTRLLAREAELLGEEEPSEEEGSDDEDGASSTAAVAVASVADAGGAALMSAPAPAAPTVNASGLTDAETADELAKVYDQLEHIDACVCFYLLLLFCCLSSPFFLEDLPTPFFLLPSRDFHYRWSNRGYPHIAVAFERQRSCAVPLERRAHSISLAFE